MSSILRRSIPWLLLLAAPAAAAGGIYVPDALAAWEGWVLEGKEYRRCPFFFDRAARAPQDFVCAWPGTLQVDVEAGGGRFSQRWSVVAGEQWLPLPGNAAYWPEAVTANGTPVTVVERGGVPNVRLAPGSYRLAGRIRWDDRPGTLPVPPQSGLVALTVDGRRIDTPEVERNGVFLGERRRATESRDAVDADVYRLVADAVPTRLVTRLEIDVSGSVREALFGPLLPDGFVPVALDSALPARLEPDGRLRVQVRPGRWTLALTARAPGVLNALSLPGQTGNNLPDDELWSYQSNERLRVTAVEGLPPVDPSRAGVPGEWQQLPAFRLQPGDTLTILERSRGLVAADNQLRLERSMWLDFDGGGFTVRDAVGGILRADWRLDMQAPYTLESATEGGEDLLVTRGDGQGQTGVELRATDLDLAAIGRVATRGEMPVSGWDARFDSVSATLYLPPGYKLLAAPGADNARGSWAGQWELLHFFLVLIITIAAYRLFGRAAGVVALAALTLSYHEFGAPAWLWLNLLIAVALLRVAPAGRLKTTVQAYLGVSALALVLALVPFVANQLRVAIYPQLEPQVGVWQYGRGVQAPMPDLAAPASAPAPGIAGQAQVRRERDVAKLQQEGRAQDRAATMEEKVVVTASRPVEPENFRRYAPNAIVQAGPGIPSWQWNANRLEWSGPVEAAQTQRFVILPRWAVTLLRFVEVLLLLAFAGVFAAEIAKRQWRLPGGLRLGRAAGAVLLFGFGTLTMLAASPPAAAQTPDPELLRELEQRLLAPPDCAPRCAEIVLADVTVGAEQVALALTIDALEAVAVPLPGTAGGWRPAAVAVAGGEAQVLRAPEQSLWLRVPAGRSEVRVNGSVAGSDSIEIAFPSPPRVVEVRAGGWFVGGVKNRRLLSGSLQLTRLATEHGGDAAPGWESNRFPPFVRVSRFIELGLDWRVTTTVERIAPETGAIALALPLVEGESVLTPDMNVTDGTMQVSMRPDQRAVSWTSSLPRRSPLALASEAGVPWVDVWRVGVGSSWHAEFGGVPETETGARGRGVRVAQFNPRGGETLTIAATRPEAVDGSTLAFDALQLAVDQGARSRTSSLRLHYRSTRGAQHVIQLPVDAKVTQVQLDGAVEPLRADAGRLTLPILPGQHTIDIRWNRDGGAGLVTATPAVDLAAPASNLRLNLALPESRWLLATSGPRLGPAVLYWSELAVLILLAVILGRIDWTPLRTHHWLLLGLGFSTFNWPVLGVVAAWLVIVGARDRWRADGPRWRYNLQQLLVVLLTVAALLAIVISLPIGLLGTPDMHVTGNDSSGNALSWFADQSAAAMPVAKAVSVPMWIYKVLILVWALWLSFALLRWLPWTWQCFARDGFFRARGDERGKPAPNGAA